MQMINKIYGQIFKKSPWDDQGQEENIFTKKRKDSFNFDEFQFSFNPIIIILAIVGIYALWLASGFYKIDEGEQALVIRFGKFHRIGTAGLNYHLPTPIETIYVEKVDQSRRLEIGYRSTGKARIGGAVSSTDVKNESIMLTGDENIVSLNVDVTWHINDLSKYYFNITDPQDTVKAVASSAIREVVGNTPITPILSNKKQMIAEKIEKLMQSILDQYESGVIIEQVKLLKADVPEEVVASYIDVQTAKTDKQKIINESEAYRNDILPRARGEAAKILEEANGYKVEILSRAEGDTSRFDSVYNQYITAREITENRLYLETIESILRKSNKVIMGSDMLPHMAVNQKNLFDNK